MGPIARFCLRHELSIQDCFDMTKVAFVGVAEEEIRKSTLKINVSRISAMTGLYRRDVREIYVEKSEFASERPQSVLGRTLSIWEQDPRYSIKKNGEPRLLSYDGPGSEFFELVKEISQHVGAATILFELERMGSVKKTPKGLKLLRRGVIVKNDPQKVFQMVADDLAQEIIAAEENIAEVDPIGNVHIRTEYDNICQKDLPEIRTWLLKQTKILHKKTRDFLAARDKDLSAKVRADEPGGAKVALCSFSLVQLPPDQE